MPHPAAALVDQLTRTRAAQERELQRLGRGPTLEQQREMGKFAARHRQLFDDLELSIPAPGPTATPGSYRLELLSRLQRRISSTWRDTDLRRLAATGALAPVERQIVEEARRVASDKTVGSFRHPGQLREIRRVDAAGQTSTDFYGDPLSWMAQFRAPVCMVEGLVDQRSGRDYWRWRK